MVYLWVGDSRIYLLRAGKGLACLTQDDSYLRKLVQEHVISECEVSHIEQATYREELSPGELTYFDKRNGITQALGDPQPLVIHMDQTPIGPGDRILLCTDGVHDNLTDLHIEEVLRSCASSTAARMLVECAAEYSRQEARIMMRAKPDDMSAVVVTYQGGEFGTEEDLRA
jgi:protein phosphatase